MASHTLERRLVALISADVKDYSRLIAEHELETVHRMAAIRQYVGELVPEYRGRVVDFTGDNFLAEFQSALDAVQCACELQQTLAAENASGLHGVPVVFRIGIHLGDVLVEDEQRLYGDGVNIAARLEGLAAPGGICISGTVYDLLRNKLDLPYEDLGAQSVKNIAYPIRVYQVLPSSYVLQGSDSSPSPVRQYGLVDRQEELTNLKTLVDQALQGRGGVALLSGEAGIGKTCLAAEAAAYAVSRGVTVLVGHNYANEGVPAYWPWIEMLRGLNAMRQFRSMLSRYVSTETELTRLLRQESGDTLLDQLSEIELGSGQFRLFDCVARLLREVAAERALVLLMDDLHWADASSLALLEFMAGHMSDARITIIATYRDEVSRAGTQLSRTLLGLARQQGVMRLPLRGISCDAAGILIRRILGAIDPEWVVEIHQKSEGNPFFIKELAYQLHSARSTVGSIEQLGIPDTIRELVQHRLEPLGKDLKEALVTAAVLGREFSVEVLRCMCDHPIDVIESILEEALHSHLLERSSSGGRTYRFSHALIRDTLYRAVSPARRAQLHALAGSVLEQQHQLELHVWASDIAYHFRHSLPYGDRDKAVTYGQLAGRVAMSRYAYDNAVEHFERALELVRMRTSSEASVEGELLLRLAEARYRAGAREGIFEAYEQAAVLARNSGNNELLARAALGLSGTGVPLDSDARRSQAVLEEALVALGDRQDRLTVQVLSRLATMPHSAAEHAKRAIQRANNAIRLARDLDDPEALAFALDGRHTALAGPEFLDERIACAEELVRLGAELRQPERSLIGHYALIIDFLEAGTIDALHREIATHERLARETNQPMHLWRAMRIQAMQALLEGDYPSAERAANEALRLGQRVAGVEAFLNYGVQIFQVRWAQGRLAELREPIELLVAQRPTSVALLAGLALLECIEGRREVGASLFERLAERGFHVLPRNPEWTTALVSLVATAVCLGDAARAAQLYELIEPYRASNITVGATHCFGSGSHYLGMLAAVQGRWHTAEAHFEDALARHSQMKARPLLARTLFEYGRLCLARGDAALRQRGEQMLRSSEELAALMHMKSLSPGGIHGSG